MFTATLVCSVARCLRNLGSMKGAACLGQHHSADTLRNDHGFPGSPELPNRGSQGGTSKVWPPANCAHSSTGLGSRCRAAKPSAAETINSVFLPNADLITASEMTPDPSQGPERCVEEATAQRMWPSRSVGMAWIS